MQDWCSLGLMAELKHDTVLYGSAARRSKRRRRSKELPVGYVEPNLRLFEKLSWLLQHTTAEERDMLGEQGAKLTGLAR